MSLVKTIFQVSKQFPTPPAYLQLSIKVDNAKAISDLANYFKRQCAALHLRLKDENNIEYKKDILKYNLPSFITDLQQAGKFAGLNFTPPMEDAFGSIAINEQNKIIVLNVNHHFGDYEFFKFLLHNFYNNNVTKETPHFPRFTSDVFKKEIERSPKKIAYKNDSKMTRIEPPKEISDTKSKLPNIFGTNYSSAFHPKEKDYNLATNVIDKNTHQKVFMEEEEIIIPQEYYKSYNQIKKAPEFMTEYLWLSHYFAASAYKGDLFKSFKVKTLVDLRKHLRYQPDFEDCYHCSIVAPYVQSISADDKLFNVVSILRNDLEKKINEKEHFSAIKATIETPKSIPGIDFGIIGLGAFNIQKPIVDLHCSFLSNATKIGDKNDFSGTLYMMSFSPFNQVSPSNEIVTKLIYNPNVFPYKYAGTYMRRVSNVLTNASLSQTVGEVFDEIKKIY